MFDCGEWREERETLTQAYGGRVESLGAVMRGMVADPRKWVALLEFAAKVMNKEEVEREEQAERRRDEELRETEELLGGLRRRAGQPMSRRGRAADRQLRS